MIRGRFATWSQAPVDVRPLFPQGSRGRSAVLSDYISKKWFLGPQDIFLSCKTGKSLFSL